jgi:L-cystine transport system permease protein
MMHTFSVDFFIRTIFVCLKAVPVTLFITGVTLLVSLPLGLLFALVRMNYPKTVPGALINAYITVFRGIPIVIQILMLYDMFPPIFAAVLRALNVSYNIYGLNPMVYALIIFSCGTSANLAEVFRSALSTVDRGQYEAGVTIGLTPFRTMKRIVIPQALVSALPNLCTATVNLIKTTSLAFIMTVREITAVAKVAAGVGYNYLEAYGDIWIIYIVVCLLVERLFTIFEKRLSLYKAV